MDYASFKDKILIEERHEMVELFINNSEFATSLAASIKQIGDLERLISKVAVSRITPREVVQIQRALYAVENIKNNANL